MPRCCDQRAQYCLVVSTIAGLELVAKSYPRIGSHGICCEYAVYRLLFAGSYSPAVYGCPLDGEADGEADGKAETGTVWSIYIRLVLRFLGI